MAQLGGGNRGDVAALEKAGLGTTVLPKNLSAPELALLALLEKRRPTSTSPLKREVPTMLLDLGDVFAGAGLHVDAALGDARAVSK